MIIREKIELSKERKLQHEAEDGSIIYAKAIFYYSHKKDVDAFLSWIIIVLLYSFFWLRQKNRVIRNVTLYSL